VLEVTGTEAVGVKWIAPGCCLFILLSGLLLPRILRCEDWTLDRSDKGFQVGGGHSA
jgi:hypothetical protein